MRPTPPSRRVGIAVAVLMIVVETLLLYPLRSVVAPLSPGMIYIIGVLVVSMVWGMWLGMLTAVSSAAAFAIFHVPPFGRVAVSDVRELAEVGAFFVVAMATSVIANVFRLRIVQATESDLTAEMARLLLHADNLPGVLPVVARRIAETLELPEAVIDRAAVAGDDRHWAFPLRAGATSLGTLRVPRGVPEPTLQRLRQRVAPSLASLLLAGHERLAMVDSLQASRKQLRRLAGEQAALRRVATLVARGGRPPEVFQAITTELYRLLAKDAAQQRYTTWLLRYEADGMVTVVSTSLSGLQPEQMHWSPEGQNVLALVWDTGRPARMDSFDGAIGPAAELARQLGIRSAVGVPIVVQGQLWGVAAVASDRPDPLPPGTERRVANFVDLAATAIANADSRAELVASRARLVAAADQARQRIERELHDSALQQTIGIGLRLSLVQASLLPEQEQARAELSNAVRCLNDVVDNMRELSRGIHPTLLAAGGLQPAIRSLARKSPIPVELDTDAGERLPSVVEIAAYHVVSEALTNTAKHAHASVVHVQAATRDNVLRVSVRDDGVGGADPGRGSGITALRDRVEALGGQLTITSPANGGTSLQATIPVAPPEPNPLGLGHAVQCGDGDPLPAGQRRATVE
ncbi:DUF4118 domain-containing protein [Dactylosporangium sp. CA-139066]|uniref:GAF domain-containing sensor histidine kinase n=1 Tax=Dactylosporangium sp. CA-139066 TaxID=3239930 RepID=UPI003D9208C7